ncbi:MAG: neutral/alkaline non-lysosomal ceramidase N-terminal domain-containing protein [Candidatus Omnitrophica bacterium]|nr:neutral/alkaline non-lysosomal ceramidase N-terminal domain-containing protein [Candidatus Omnitrophota bacterium]
MKCGFGRVDITPRVGVELCGFGPFLNRHSLGVREKLWAKAAAIEVDSKKLVLVSCDLIGIDGQSTKKVRQLVKRETGWPEESVMLHCTHTHSGPTTINLIGWGESDPPYRELLPYRISHACVQAIKNLVPAKLSYAEVECPGIGKNREFDESKPTLEEVLAAGWQPARPELTDTICHVFAFHSGDNLIGFMSYFGCHPVVCCSQTRWLHGDFCGVATNQLERDFPGSTGLFLQGAHGDVNTCVVHQPEPESLLALNEIAGRYARAVRQGLNQAQPVKVDCLKVASHLVRFRRHNWTATELKKRLNEQEKIVCSPEASDADPKVRMAMVYLLSLRHLLAARKAGLCLEPTTEIQGFRLGPFLFLSAPFEIFQSIKNEVVNYFRPSPVFVMSVTNDYLGYAPDKLAEKRGGYAAQSVPLILGSLPFKNIHQQLVANLITLGKSLK